MALPKLIDECNVCLVLKGNELELSENLFKPAIHELLTHIAKKIYFEELKTPHMITIRMQVHAKELEE